MRLPDVSTPEAREQARKEQHARYERFMREAARYRELALSDFFYTPEQRRHLMELSDDARARAYHEVA